ncbi:MAG: VTT domain-containing protein [Candidatus Pacebacteria bacterium]|nr:VTT domain-containing protein [Candidatus Paceibacterota bacterium]
MIPSLKKLIPGIFEFSIATFLLVFILAYDLLGLPNAIVVSEFFLNQYEKYGFWIILLAAFLEALFILSIYIPASLVIVLSAFALGFDIQTLLKIGVISILGFMLANILNYYLGKFGYYKLLLKLGGNQSVEKIQNDFSQNPNKTIFFTSFHPNFLAITMISAGIAKSNLLKVIFQSLISLIFWISLWMSVIYIFFKDSQISFTENENQAFYFVGILILWGVAKCIISAIKNRKY